MHKEFGYHGGFIFILFVLCIKLLILKQLDIWMSINDNTFANYNSIYIKL